MAIDMTLQLKLKLNISDTNAKTNFSIKFDDP